ncbi:MAG: hypothetical protein WDN23_11790 [Edaphobacter sp.]
MKLINNTHLLLAALCLAISTPARAQDCLSNLPPSLKSAVEQDNWKILSPFDVPSVDWKLWKNAHQDQCPGVAVGNFYPKTKSSYVVALIQGDDPKNLIEKVVLVAEKKDQTIVETIVPPAQTTTPALVWRLPPGHYASIDGTQAGISRDSIVYEKVAATARQFYYHDGHVQSFPISN